MKSWTAHLKPGRPPVLVPEAFTTGAFIFGPLWFAVHRAWVPAAIHLLLIVLVLRFLPGVSGVVVLIGLDLLAGLMGRDLVRWSLERRGYTLAHVLAARDEESALARLLTYRPEVAASLAASLA